MSVSERVRGVVEPVVAAEGVELFDLEQAGPVLRITIDRPGGLDMKAIAAVTRAVSRALDEHDPIADQYTLEVSSPGLERPLRTPGHFTWAIGRQVSVKTVPGHEAGRRFAGTVAAADATGVTLSLDEPVGEQVVSRMATSRRPARSSSGAPPRNRAPAPSRAPPDPPSPRAPSPLLLPARRSPPSPLPEPRSRRHEEP